MGFFNWFKKEKTRKEETPCLADRHKVDDSAYEQALREIAGIISGDDKNIASELNEYIMDAEKYFHDHLDEFMDAAEFEGYGDMKKSAGQKWLTLVMILEKGHYVCSRDWKDERDDFVYFVQGLTFFKENHLTLRPEWLRREGNISEWCSLLDERWKMREMCVGAIDTDSDEYVLFVCKETDLEKLKKIAVKINRRIDSAKNM